MHFKRVLLQSKRCHCVTILAVRVTVIPNLIIGMLLAGVDIELLMWYYFKIVPTSTPRRMLPYFQGMRVMGGIERPLTGNDGGTTTTTADS